MKLKDWVPESIRNYWAEHLGISNIGEVECRLVDESNLSAHVVPKLYWLPFKLGYRWPFYLFGQVIMINKNKFPYLAYRPKSDRGQKLIRLVLHELGHVRQIQEGRGLEGFKYAGVPYAQNPIEQEAEEGKNRLWDLRDEWLNGH